MKSPRNSSLTALATSALFLAAASNIASGATYTWDTATGDGATVTSGTGAWNTTAGNTVWNSGTTNVIWAQTSGTVGLHDAVFAGSDGTVDQHTVTLGASMAAQSLTFNSSGYNITSGTLSLRPTTTTNGSITVAANKTATISSLIGYSNNNTANITVNSGATLKLGGGASNSQYQFTGGGTVNMTGGAYSANVGNTSNAAFNQSGGTFTITPGNNLGYNISSGTQNVAYNLSGGSIVLNGNNTTATVNGAHLSIGNGTTTAYTSTLNVNGGNLSVGGTASRSGEIQIAKTGSSNGTLNVSSGTVTVGTGATANKIYFFKAGSSAGYTANMTHSGGTVTANGIQFGGSTGATTYDSTSSASLELSGGSLYIGAQGITRGTDASALPTTIKLLSGTIGASAGWSSSLDMKIGAITIRGGTPTSANNITLSGVLSDDSSAGTLTKTGSGTLTLSGTNTYTGATTITSGTLALGATDVLSNSTNVSIGAATLSVATTHADTVGTLDPTGAATINLGAGATLAFADSSAIDWTGGTLNIIGFVRDTSLRFGTSSSGLTADQLLKITADGISNFVLNEDGYLSTGDSTEPTLVSIVDNRGGGSITEGTTITYTVTFSEAIEPTSISAEDFFNAGTGVCTIGTVSQVSPTVFTVPVTNTTAGTIILQIPDTASIADIANNLLVCDPPINDDNEITVNTTPLPTLSASNIADDKTGQIVAPNMMVTYTFTFGEDIDDATVTSADFGNAGTASITIGTITEIAPGVFTVEVTPTTTGTLQFGIKAGAVIKSAVSGNVLDTVSAIVDADTVTVGSYLFWDTNSSDGSTITSGSGAWNTTAGNLAWNNLSTNVIWSQTNSTLGSNGAVFGGADGSTNEHLVTLGGAMAARSLNFNSSGYRLTSGTIAVTTSSTTNGNITVEAGKTATIDSVIAYIDNKDARITSNSGATLNLGGGATNSQYRFQGAGTINMTAGSYSADVGFVNVPTFNQSGGTFIMSLPAGTDRYNIGSAAGQSVIYTLSGGTISANAGADSRTNSHLAIGRAAGNTAYANILNVQGAGVLNVGTSTNRSGELHIANTANANGTLNVTGGTVTIGTGKADNKIYFFKAGSSAGYTANMTQSGGTVTANGIQFGGSTGATTYDATSSASLELSGGSLYIGAQGITRGSDASALPTTIKLLSGTIGASAGWSSSLDMKIGAITIRGGTPTSANNITLSGVLSDDSSAGTLTKTGSGTLTLSGPNSYTGATLVNGGTLALENADAASSSSSLTIANGAALALTNGPSTVPNLTYAGTGTLSLNVASGAVLTVISPDGLTNSGAAGSITINITGTAPASGTYTLIDYDGTLQGTGYSAYTLGATPTGKVFTLAHDSENGAVQLVVTSNYSWTGAEGSEWSTAAIGGSKNWSKDASAIDYANDSGAIFDNTATSYIVDISGADVTPLSVDFNSGTYTLQGTHTIAGSGPVTVASGATLKLGSSNKLPDGAGAGIVTINGTLDLNGNSETINALTGSGTVDNTAADTTSTLTIDANTNGNFSGSIMNTVGTLELVKTGTVDAILSGSNSYSGATTINQGRLFISSANALSPSTAVTVNSGASFVFNAAGTYAQSITLNSGANLAQRQAATLSNVTLPTSGSVIFNNDGATTQAFTLSSTPALTGELTVQVGGGSGSAGAVTLGGILSGSGGSLVKTGTGTLSLSGSNTFDGGVTIKNGTLESKTTQFTLGTGTVTMGGAGSAGATFITGQNNSNPFVINEPDSGNIVIGANGAGSGFTMSGGFTLNGDLSLQTFQNVISGSTTARLTFSGGVTGTGNLLLNNIGLAANTITISGTSVNHTGGITVSGTAATGDTTISAPIGSNVTGITQNSATSTLVLSGSNSYACNLTVNAGTVRISNNSNTANDVSTVTIASAGTLNLTYAGTDTVKELFIGLDKQPAGVYGKIGSTDPSVTQTIAQITGDGTLTVGAPEIAVEEPAGTDIVNNGSRDFGSVEVGQTASLTFTIRNSGDLPLNLTGVSELTDVSGEHAADFTISAAPSSSLIATDTTTFTVDFTPSAEGVRNAQISIANNDSDENPFVISLSGTGTITVVTAPEIVVEQPALTEIASGGSQDFDTVTLGSNTELTFTIRNSGDANLNLTGNSLVEISGTDAADFTVTSNPDATIAAAGTTTFTVRFAPSATGARSASLTIANNDSDEGSYVINLTGTGQSAYDAWSGGATFNADANGDGVSNGLAWILGAADANANARSLLPSATISGTNLVFTFKRVQASISASVALTVEVGTTLSTWSDSYTVGTNTAGSTSGVAITQNSPSAGTDTVTVTIPRGADTKKFARLKAVQTP